MRRGLLTLAVVAVLTSSCQSSPMEDDGMLDDGMLAAEEVAALALIDETLASDIERIPDRVEPALEIAAGQIGELQGALEARGDRFDVPLMAEELFVENATPAQAEIARFARTYRDEPTDRETQPYSTLERLNQRARDHYVIAIVLQSGDAVAATELAAYVSSGEAFQLFDRPEIDATLEAKVVRLMIAIDLGFLRFESES